MDKNRLSAESNSDRDASQAPPHTQSFTGKYERSGRIGKLLISRFFSAAKNLLEPVLPDQAEVLEVGCGPGYSTDHIKRWEGVRHLVAGEPEDAVRALAERRNPDIKVLSESVYCLTHADDSLDCVIMLEVLEHLDDPEAALAELHRVTRGVVLISTPREPLWRTLNCARGKYLSSLGNTPGHIQHWSSRGLIRQVSPLFDVIGCAKPIPWTILLLKPRKT